MGCKKCISLADMIRKKADELGVEIELVKIEDPAEIAGWGIMITPAVIIDDKIVHKGRLPSAADIEKWLND